MSPRAAITLDYESDYATESFECLEATPRLVDLCERMRVPLTCFVEGRVLRDQRRHLEAFAPGTEFGLHCNDHRRVPDAPEALKLGVAAFEAAFGRRPLGYRAGNYIMTPELMDALRAENFAYDASYLPGFTAIEGLGRDTPEKPFRMANGLWEVPVTRLPGAKVKAAMSQVSLLSLPVFRYVLGRAMPPDPLVFVVHMHDIFRSPALRTATWRRRLGHEWNYRFGWIDPLARFERVLVWLKGLGYDFVRLGDLIP